MWNPFRDENHSLFPFFRCFFVSFFFVCLLTQPKRNLCTFGTMVILIYVTSNSSFEHSTFLAHMNGVLGQKPLFLSRNNNKKLCAKDKNHVRSGGNKKCFEIFFFFSFWFTKWNRIICYMREMYLFGMRNTCTTYGSIIVYGKQFESKCGACTFFSSCVRFWICVIVSVLNIWFNFDWIANFGLNLKIKCKR